MKPKTKGRYYELSKKETEMMEILWEAGEPLSRAEILERAEGRQCTWKPNSIHVILNHLLDKKAVQVTGYYLDSRKLGRNFQAAITPQDYALMQLLHASKLAKEAGVPLEEQLTALKPPAEK